MQTTSWVYDDEIQDTSEYTAYDKAMQDIDNVRRESGILIFLKRRQLT